MRISDWSSDVCSSDLGSGPQRKTHSSRSRVGFQIVAIVVLELLEIVVDLKLGVFLRIRVRHAFGLVRRENGIAEGSFLLLASWSKGFVAFVRLRFIVDLSCHELAQAGRLGVSRVAGLFHSRGCGGAALGSVAGQKKLYLVYPK